MNRDVFLAELKNERRRVRRQLAGLSAAIRAFRSPYNGNAPRKRRKPMSAASRKKIAAAQRARWARARAR